MLNCAKSIRTHSPESALRRASEKTRGVHQSHIPGVSNSTLAACESPLTGEEDSKRGTLGVMNQARDQIYLEKPYQELWTAAAALLDF